MIEFASPPSEVMLEAPGVRREPLFEGVMRFRADDPGLSGWRPPASPLSPPLAVDRGRHGGPSSDVVSVRRHNGFAPQAPRLVGVEREAAPGGWMAKVGNVAGQGGSIGTSPPSAMSSLREGPPQRNPLSPPVRMRRRSLDSFCSAAPGCHWVSHCLN